MANVKISGLTSASLPLVGSELLELVQSGSSTKVAASAVADSGKAYGGFYSTQDQTFVADTPKALTLNNSETFNTGVSVVSSSRITFAVAGTYAVTSNIQLVNTDSADHDVTVWYRLNGVDIANSATRITVPKVGDGGAAFFELSNLLKFTAGQYLELVAAVENAAVSADYTAAIATPFTAPAVPSVIFSAHRVGL